MPGQPSMGLAGSPRLFNVVLLRRSIIEQPRVILRYVTRGPVLDFAEVHFRCCAAIFCQYDFGPIRVI